MRNGLARRSPACFAPLATTNETSLLKRGLQSSSGKPTRSLTRDASSQRWQIQQKLICRLGRGAATAACPVSPKEKAELVICHLSFVIGDGAGALPPFPTCN